MIVEDLRLSSEPNVTLHAGQEAATLWTDLRLAQPGVANTREAVLNIADHFGKLVIRYLRERHTDTEIVPLVVMRGGAVFLNTLWREVGDGPVGFVLPIARASESAIDIVYSETPSSANAHYVVFDLVVNSGQTIDSVLRNLYGAKQAGLPEPLGIHIAAPFSTVVAARRIINTYPELVFHSIWNGLRRRANGWLTGLDFDAGDVAFGQEPRVRNIVGKAIAVPNQAEVPEYMNKVAGLIRSDRGILVVRKSVSGRAEFIMPGGKPIPGETQERTLRRELHEELDVEVRTIKWFGWFEDEATFEAVPIGMDVYEVEIEGVPRPSSEIVELRWISGTYAEEGTSVGNLLKNGVLPALERVGAR